MPKGSQGPGVPPGGIATLRRAGPAVPLRRTTDIVPFLACPLLWGQGRGGLLETRSTSQISKQKGQKKRSLSGGTYLRWRSEIHHPVVDGPGWVTPWGSPGRPPSGTEGGGEVGLVPGREDPSWRHRRRMIRGTSSSSSSSPVEAALTRVWSQVTGGGGLEPREGETGFRR